jgi:glycosyltransferase involved in cell wall biosynthesis
LTIPPKTSPFFSICIPQYNRSSFLLQALQRLCTQTFQDFEVCISDDRSPDGRQQEIIDFLKVNRMRFCFESNARNLRYDGNLRSALALSSGKYCLLMGNDDGLTDDFVLSRYHEALSAQPNCGVMITNFREQNGTPTRRIRQDALYKGSAAISAAVWRDFSFISGIVFDGPSARALATDRFDGTEYYQLYLGARIIASGKDYLASTMVAVDKDLIVPGEKVADYTQRPKQRVSALAPIPSTQQHLVRLVAEGIAGTESEPTLRAARFHALWQFTVFTLAYWIVAYRRAQSWSYASAFGLGLSPKYTAPFALGWHRRSAAWVLWYLTYTVALSVPTSLFFAIRPMLHQIAKSFRPGAKKNADGA